MVKNNIIMANTIEASDVQYCIKYGSNASFKKSFILKNKLSAIPVNTTANKKNRAATLL